MPQSQSSFVRSAKKFYKKLNFRALPITSLFGIVGGNFEVMALFKQTVRFASDAAGLERTLRLFQALCQTLAFYPWLLATLLMGRGKTKSRAKWDWWAGKGRGGSFADVQEGLVKARGELALGRRYLRFFRFVGCFEKAWDIFKYDSGLRMLIGVGKSGFMGAYLLLESLTILDMMGVWTSPWAEFLMVEGNKFWFYALIVSIFGELYELWYVCFSGSQPAATTKSRTSEKSSTASSKEKTKRQWEKRSKIKGIALRIVADATDLFVPGAVTGWIPMDPGVVGIATMVSTVLSSRDLWERAGRR